MHIALLIPELLGSILGYLEDIPQLQPFYLPREHTYGSGRKALAALASTCRALSEPALNVLWRRLYTLKPLMLCVATKASLARKVYTLRNHILLVWHSS